ncbi:MAG: recombination mediator RecR [Bernardetiaceae bacterium]
MHFPSQLIETAVMEFAKLPGIGKKTALRHVLHLLKQSPEFTESLAAALVKMRQEVKFCRQCHAISDQPLCQICSSLKRDAEVICVVESDTDLLAIENTAKYVGHYHVLGGVISPINGIGPEDLNIETLLQRVQTQTISEVILALSATMEGDTTSFYLTKKLREHSVKISTIARGIPIGSELEFTDEITLGRSITGRIRFD